jgi:hypothetical protein
MNFVWKLISPINTGSVVFPNKTVDSPEKSNTGDVNSMIHHFGKTSLIHQDSFHVIISNTTCYDKRVTVGGSWTSFRSPSENKMVCLLVELWIFKQYVGAG